MKSKTILLSALVLAIAIVSSALIISNRNNSANQPTKPEGEKIKTEEGLIMGETELESDSRNGFKLFTSEQAGLSIELPDHFVMMESEEKQQFQVENATSGVIEFTTDPNSENAANKIVIPYGKPEIYGKGGACVDKNGNPAFAAGVVAGVSMEVCKTDLYFSAAYIKNQNQAIEYSVFIYSDNEELFEIMINAVANKLVFQ